MAGHVLRLVPTLAAFLVLVSSEVVAQPVLDPNFGTGGKTFVDFGTDVTPNAMLRQPDGTILTGGYARFGGGPGGDAIALSRHLPNGSPDPGFGTGGMAVRQFTFRDQLNGMARQPDGKIVAVGVRSASTAGSLHISSIYRFNADGSTDSSFSDDGWTAWRYDAVSSGEFADVTVLPDGNLLAAGVCRGNINGGQYGFGAMRFLPNGDLDPSYGTRLFHLPNLGPGRGHAAFTPDGGVIYANQISLPAPEFVLMRIDASGVRDTSFGSGGFAFPGIATFNASFDTPIRLLPDGRILVAGTTNSALSRPQYTVLRFQSNGTLDTTFGVGGRTASTKRGASSPSARRSANRASEDAGSLISK